MLKVGDVVRFKTTGWLLLGMGGGSTRVGELAEVTALEHGATAYLRHADGGKSVGRADALEGELAEVVGRNEPFAVGQVREGAIEDVSATEVVRYRVTKVEDEHGYASGMVVDAMGTHYSVAARDEESYYFSKEWVSFVAKAPERASTGHIPPQRGDVWRKVDIGTEWVFTGQRSPYDGRAWQACLVKDGKAAAPGTDGWFESTMRDSAQMVFLRNDPALLGSPGQKPTPAAGQVWRWDGKLHTLTTPHIVAGHHTGWNNDGGSWFATEHFTATKLSGGQMEFVSGPPEVVLAAKEHDWERWRPTKDTPNTGDKVFKVGQVWAWQIYGGNRIDRVTSLDRTGDAEVQTLGDQGRDRSAAQLGASSPAAKVAVLVQDVDMAEPFDPRVVFAEYVMRSNDLRTLKHCIACGAELTSDVMFACTTCWSGERREEAAKLWSQRDDFERRMAASTRGAVPPAKQASEQEKLIYSPMPTFEETKARAITTPANPRDQSCAAACLACQKPAPFQGCYVCSPGCERYGKPEHSWQELMLAWREHQAELKNSELWPEAPK